MFSSLILVWAKSVCVCVCGLRGGATQRGRQQTLHVPNKDGYRLFFRKSLTLILGKEEAVDVLYVTVPPEVTLIIPKYGARCR